MPNIDGFTDIRVVQRQSLIAHHSKRENRTPEHIAKTILAGKSKGLDALTGRGGSMPIFQARGCAPGG